MLRPMSRTLILIAYYVRGSSKLWLLLRTLCQKDSAPSERNPIVERTPIGTRANYVGILEEGIQNYRAGGRVLKVPRDLTFDALVMVFAWLWLLYLDV